MPARQRHADAFLHLPETIVLLLFLGEVREVGGIARQLDAAQTAGGADANRYLALRLGHGLARQRHGQRRPGRRRPFPGEGQSLRLAASSVVVIDQKTQDVRARIERHGGRGDFPERPAGLLFLLDPAGPGESVAVDLEDGPGERPVRNRLNVRHQRGPGLVAQCRLLDLHDGGRPAILHPRAGRGFATPAIRQAHFDFVARRAQRHLGG